MKADFPCAVILRGNNGLDLEPGTYNVTVEGRANADGTGRIITSREIEFTIIEDPEIDDNLGNIGINGGNNGADDIDNNLGDIDVGGGNNGANDIDNNLGNIGVNGGNNGAADIDNNLGNIGVNGGNNGADDIDNNLGNIGVNSGNNGADDIDNNLGNIGVNGGNNGAADIDNNLGNIGVNGGNNGAADIDGNLGGVFGLLSSGFSNLAANLRSDNASELFLNKAAFSQQDISAGQDGLIMPSQFDFEQDFNSLLGPVSEAAPSAPVTPDQIGFADEAIDVSIEFFDIF